MRSVHCFTVEEIIFSVVFLIGILVGLKIGYYYLKKFIRFFKYNLFKLLIHSEASMELCMEFSMYGLIEESDSGLKVLKKDLRDDELERVLKSVSKFVEQASEGY